MLPLSNSPYLRLGELRLAPAQSGVNENLRIIFAIETPANRTASPSSNREVLAFLRKTLYDPLLQLLNQGATPEKLAWSIAIGLVIGVNPLLGSTTLVALAAAPLFRLNLVASQIGNHVVYPLQLLLFPVFIKLGDSLFHTPGLPLTLKTIAENARHHPWDTTRGLWRWEWHALIVWVAFACAAAPLLYLALRPALQRMFQRLRTGSASA